MGIDQDASNNSGLQLILGLALSLTPEDNTTITTPSPSNKVIDDQYHRPRKPQYSSNFITACATSNNYDEAEAEPSLTLGLLSGEQSKYYHSQQVVKVVPKNKGYCEDPLLDLYSTQTSPHSGVSSFSSGGVKRERDILRLSSEEVEAERVNSSRASDEDEDGTTAARKKLRLTKDQSAMLEESFKLHSTLNPKQKQALARQLNLRPRQVEVWFQNRRARTKLKQTEVDCEFLKKCCETLTDENRRLQKEVQELKALKLAQPLYMPMPAATLTMCPSCERFGGVSGGASNIKTPFSMAPKPHFYNPFANPSAAC